MAKKLTKKRIVELLNSIGCHNIYDIAEKGSPMLGYSSRSGMINEHWSVKKKGYRFTNASWYEHGGKNFSAWPDKQKGFEEAMAFIKAVWPKELWPDVEMVKSPFGGNGWVNKADLDKKIAKALDFEKENQKDETNL